MTGMTSFSILLLLDTSLHDRLMSAGVRRIVLYSVCSFDLGSDTPEHIQPQKEPDHGRKERGGAAHSLQQPLFSWRPCVSYL